jgi:hypothetical protein
MPIPPSSPPIHYQIVPIRHSTSFHQILNSMQSTNELNSFQSFRDRREMNDENGNRQSTLKSRTSPYYYHELSNMHATNNNIESETTFRPINNSESFSNFMTSMYPDNI